MAVISHQLAGLVDAPYQRLCKRYLHKIVSGKPHETESDGHCQQENTSQNAVNHQGKATGTRVAPLETTKHPSDLLVCGLKDKGQ